MEELSFAVGRVPRHSSRVVSCIREALLRVNRLDFAPFGLRLQGHDAVSGKVIASLCKDIASDVFGPNQLSYFIIYERI